MILVDTSVIAAWIDPDHHHHQECEKALLHWADQDDLAISALTYAELAAAGRTKEALDEILAGFIRIDFDFDAGFRAGQAFGRWNSGKGKKPVLPDFLIRGQASVLGLPHLTNDRHQIQAFPELEFLFP
jgi:predicted nucleic acid-binding protein